MQLLGSCLNNASQYRFRNYPIDVGGQWIGPQQLEVLALVDRFGLTLEKQKWFDNDSELALCSGASLGSPEVYVI